MAELEHGRQVFISQMVATTSSAFILTIVAMGLLGYKADDIALLDEDEQEGQEQAAAVKAN